MRARGLSDHVFLEADGRGYAVHSFGQRLSSLDPMGMEGRALTFVHDLRSQRVRYVDGGLARRLALPGAGVMNFKDFTARVHPDDLAEHGAYGAARETLADDEFTTQAIRVHDPEGEWRLIHLRSRVLRRGRDGSVRLLLGTAIDITDYAAAAVEASAALVLRAEENERARIGRELHDSTSQHLVAADLGLSRVQRGAELSEDTRERLRGIHESVAMAQIEMRAFAYFLHPPELRDLGLFKALERFCAGFARRSELEISFEAGPAPAGLSSEAEHALYRVCQEALMNVYRHAFARRVSVRLRLVKGQLVLEVRDDGVGVDSADRFEHGGVGVASMRARMTGVGGELVLDCSGPGLSVIARLPQASASRASPAPANVTELPRVQRAGRDDADGLALRPAG